MICQPIDLGLSSLSIKDPYRRRRYTARSAQQFRAACLCLRRRGVPAGVLRVHLAGHALVRRTARAPHPTNRKGHPLPPLVQALYHAHPAFRRALELALDRTPRRVASGLPASEGDEAPCARRATRGLLKVFAAMDDDCCSRDPAGASPRAAVAAWADDLEAAALGANVPLRVNAPADWFRLAHVVLSCLPAAVVAAAFVGLSGRVDRYRFPDCGHVLEERDDDVWVQQAPAARASDLVSALRARPAPAPLHDARGGASRVACPTCRLAGLALHESFPRFTPAADAAAAPKLLWIIILRSTGAGLSRHRVALPDRLYFSREDGAPVALEEGEAAPRGAPAYALAAVMLYHSKRERGDPGPEFDGDSGGRYSICVELGNGDGFYWLAEDEKEAAPVRGHAGRALLETHCHSAFYNLLNAELLAKTQPVNRLGG